ncbi:protein kinase, ATP binding site-containing protein [Tanacetum coccineum]
MSDMTTCLNDLSYIPLNNEQNEPTQRDIGKLTDSIFNEMLEFFQNEFPTTKGYKLPPSYYGEDHKDKQFCPVCNTSRWKDSNTPGKKVPKKVKVYRMPGPLIDDLKDLWALKGVETIDVATGQKFNMRAMVLWNHVFLLDVVCWRVEVGKKPYKWRRSHNFEGETEDEDPPREFNRAQIMTQLSRLPTLEKGKHSSFGGVKIKHNVLVELNCTKKTTTYGQDKGLNMLGIRSELWLSQNKSRKCSKPQAKYSFTPENRKKFCQLIKGVKIPDGFRSNFKHKVTANDSNIQAGSLMIKYNDAMFTSLRTSDILASSVLQPQ